MLASFKYVSELQRRAMSNNDGHLWQLLIFTILHLFPSIDNSFEYFLNIFTSYASSSL